jgi:hypothetical protein
MSQKFLLGPVAHERAGSPIPASAIGFDLGAEAVLARYGRSRPMVLLLVSYPTPQLAAARLRNFQELPVANQDESGRRVAIQRKGSLLAFVADAPSVEAAEQLMGRIRYETALTWNEYVPPKEENVGTVMIAIFSLAGFLLMFAFVAGLAFGGFRVFAKRFIPIAIFDRPSQLEIIRLNLRDVGK